MIIIINIIIISNNNSNNNNNNLVANIPFRMDFLIPKKTRKASLIMRSRFSRKFHFKWTFYGKLILKKCLDAKDWFRDKAAVQHKIPFQMDFLQKVSFKKMLRR